MTAHPLALPWPNAQNASERSSMHVNTCARGCCATASTSGDDRDPAHVSHITLIRCCSRDGRFRSGTAPGSAFQRDKTHQRNTRQSYESSEQLPNEHPDV